MTDTTETPVLKYTMHACELGVISDKDLLTFNKAWGLDDGTCTQIDSNGNHCNKPDLTKEFIEAQCNAQGSPSFEVEVSVFKDGSKKFRTL